MSETAETRPVECPDCDALLSDEFTWEGAAELRVVTTCSECGWHQGMLLTSEGGDDE